MKKIFAIILAITMVLSFSACGSKYPSYHAEKLGFGEKIDTEKKLDIDTIEKYLTADVLMASFSVVEQQLTEKCLIEDKIVTDQILHLEMKNGEMDASYPKDEDISCEHKDRMIEIRNKPNANELDHENIEQTLEDGYLKVVYKVPFADENGNTDGNYSLIEFHLEPSSCLTYLKSVITYFDNQPYWQSTSTITYKK